MATTEKPSTGKKVSVKEMSWDPITRIVGSLGIHTEIDFDAQKVNKCYSTSMIFRGFDIFMKGIDPRDTHFLTSRICGICGDNHCTTSVLCQNMAYGIYPPKLGNCAYNLAELADYMFDHAIYNDCMCNVDFCEQMVKDTNPGLLAKAEKTASPHGDIHGYKTIADIMRALNPFTGEFYLETLQVARYTREMYCLFGGRHTHPSTIMPGGVSADITHQTCTDYYVRLMRYVDYCKRTVPMHDDIYDFFLQELPGYDDVGLRRTPTSTATRRSPISCALSTRSPASSTSRRCRWRATRARCTACSAGVTRTRRRSCRAAAARTSPSRRARSTTCG